MKEFSRCNSSGVTSPAAKPVHSPLFVEESFSAAFCICWICFSVRPQASGFAGGR